MRTLILILLALLSSAQEPKPKHDIKGPMPAEDGETCVVCYGRCDRNDVAYMVDGQRFAIMKPLEQVFLEDPDEYIKLYKPNSIQFTSGASGLSDAYLAFGLFMLVGLMIAGYAAHQMILKRNAGAAVPAGLGKIPTTRLPAACAACGGENHPSAAVCSHCGAQLNPVETSELEHR